MHTPANTRWFQLYSTVWRPSAIPTAPSNAALKPATASVISVLGALLYGKSVYTHQIVANIPRNDRMIKNVYPGLVVCLFLLKINSPDLKLVITDFSLAYNLKNVK